ncbi:MAG: bifunctional 5,10-methylenetetrahydrofolate dehydrogenase/5,10-methenyltetrahydrofolate cyclohydrolase [Candidatus Taylorbacteria bacterium]
MPLLIDGRKAREVLLQGLKERVATFVYTPTLAIIQVGNRPDSDSYIRAKKNCAEKIGVAIEHIQVSEEITQDELIARIQTCNKDESIQGIIVQLPLPPHLDRTVVVNTIDSAKDADALTHTRVTEWSQHNNTKALFPATARGVIELLEYYGYTLVDKKVVVVGRSDLVGKPIAVMCTNEGAHVTVCHSKTLDLKAETSQADILIVAIGKPCFIGSSYVKKGAVVIDVGINTFTGEKLEEEIQNRALVGDVDFDEVQDVTTAITPVPGGVGPMTVFALFENLLDICK